MLSTKQQLLSIVFIITLLIAMLPFDLAKADSSLRLEIQYPNFNDSWYSQSEHVVVFVVYGDSSDATVSLYTSTDNVSFGFSPASQGVFSKGTSWGLHVDTTACSAGPLYLRLEAVDGSGYYARAYTKVIITNGNIVITSPNGSEQWAIGSYHNITWTSNNIKGNVNILLSRDAGTTFSNIVSNTPNDGLHAWKANGPATALGRIKIVSVSKPSVLSISEANFVISGPPVKPVLVSPKGTINTLMPALDWNDISNADSYDVQVAKDSSFKKVLLVNQSGLSESAYTIPDGILSWNTLYFWKVKASNTSGSTWSNPGQFKTSVGPPPDAPSNLTATAVSCSQVDLAWQDNSSSETGFKIERKQGTGAFKQVATVKASITGYSNKGLTASTQYTYRVRACQGSLNSGYSDEAAATTLSTPTNAPVLRFPANNGSVTSRKPTLIWDSVTGAASYRLQVSKDRSMSDLIIDTSFLISTNFTIFTQLTWDTTYFWRISSINSEASPSKWSNVWSFKTVQPTYQNIFFSQLNSAWGNENMGTSGLKIKNYGCAMTCTAMVCKWYEKDTNPKWLNSWLSNNSGYLDDSANLIWQRPADYSDGKITLESYYLSGDNYDNWDLLNDQLDQGIPVIVSVDQNTKTVAYNEHWVVVTHRVGTDYYINDPLNLSFSSKKLSSYYNNESKHTFYYWVIYRTTSGS